MIRARFAPLGALAASLVLSVPAAAQETVPRAAGPDVLAALDIEAGMLQELALPERLVGPHQVQVFVDGKPRALFLAPHSLRGPEFQVLVQGADGGWDSVEPAPVTTVRGFVLGEPESFFAGSVHQGRLEGALRLSAGDALHGIQSVASLDPTAPAGLHVVYDSEDNVPLPVFCGTEDLKVRGGEPIGSPAGGADGGSGSKWIEISCDADTQFYNQNGGSVANTQQDIELILNGCDSIYNSDFNIRYEIGTILVRTAEPDPYGTSDSSGMLNEFKIEWLSNQASIQRDVAHLFTGKNLIGSTIGVAYLNGVCSTSLGYGLSQSKFSGNLTSRIGLTAHELGHNWSANHCNGTSQCKIMCSGLGGCSGSLTSFGPAASAEIEAKRDTASCLSGPPPTTPPSLFSATPTTFEAFAAPLITVSGSALEWVESITFGGQIYDTATGFFATGDDTLYATYDNLTPVVGTASLTATNSIGTSNALNFNVTDTDPPVLVNSVWALTNIDYEWLMGGKVNDLWFLVVSVGDDTTFDFLGFPVLVNNILIGSGSLGANGIQKLTSPILPSAVGLLFHSQFAAINGSTGQFRGASAVKSAFVLL